MSKNVLTVEGVEIRLLTESKSDYISLTDLTQNFEGGNGLIEKWLRNRNTVEFLGMWEKIYNPDFNEYEFKELASTAGLNSFMLSVKKWIERTGAIGVEAKAGRGGGTYAHKDIALEFCTWLSPLFKLYVVKEFDRLKQVEYDRLAIEWSVKRTLAKVNYRVHTDAVKLYLIPPRLANTKQEGIVYASEADMLNLALFGMTSKQWQDTNPTLKGNIRDNATAEQLLVLANLETLNAHFIKEGISQSERLIKLNETAIYQMELFAETTTLKQLKVKNIRLLK
jgi:KilA-N domain